MLVGWPTVKPAVTNVVVRPDRGRQFCAVAYVGEDLLDRADDCDHCLSAGYEDAVREGLRRHERCLVAGRRRKDGHVDISEGEASLMVECP